MAVVRERAYRGSVPQAVADAGRAGAEEVLRQAAAELAGIFRRNRYAQMILFREAHTHAELQEPAAGLVASSTEDLAGLLAGVPGTRADVQDRLAAARLLVAGLLMDNFRSRRVWIRRGSSRRVRLLAAALSSPTAPSDSTQPKESGFETLPTPTAALADGAAVPDQALRRDDPSRFEEEYER